MESSWKDHFKPNNFLLNHDDPSVFITSQWQRDKKTPSFVYAFVRFAIFATFFSIWVLTLTSSDSAYNNNTRWPVYLTNWGFTICMLQSFFAVVVLKCVLVLARVMKTTEPSINVLGLYKIYWALNVMATTLAFTITLVFWSLLYNASDDDAPFDTMNFLVHGANSILMFVDFWIVFHPVRLLHFIYPVLIGVVYLIMTIMFYVLGGTMKDGSRYIYPILRWDKPGLSSLYCLAVMLLMITIHTITFFLYKIRTKIGELFYGEDKGSSNCALYNP